MPLPNRAAADTFYRAAAFILLLMHAGAGIAAAPADAPIRLDTVAFPNSHHVLRQNTQDLLTGGSVYPTIAWSRQPARNCPISQTGSERIRVRLNLQLKDMKQGQTYEIIGASPEPSLSFRTTGRLPKGKQILTVEAEAKEAPGRTIRKMSAIINWTITLDPGTPRSQRFALGQTGPHIVYVTRGKPKHTNEPLSVVTDIRMERAIAVVQAATAKAGKELSDAKIVYALMKLNAKYYRPLRHFERKQVWLVPDSWQMNPPGASCISIVGFADRVCKMLGLEGETRLTAFYGDPERPHRAKAGGLGDNPIRKVGDDGNVWQLFMVDGSNTRNGQVGGVGGMNYYESVLDYELRGRHYYFPGGTDAVLGSPEGSLYVFRTLAWARYEPSLGNYVVMEVVAAYTPDDREFPHNILLPSDRPPTPVHAR